LELLLDNYLETLSRGTPTPGRRAMTISNVLGIDGVRGAGKSTVLHALYERWSAPPEKGSEAAARWARLGEIFPLPPIDCSVLQPGVHPGVAVLLRVRDDWWVQAGNRDSSYQELSDDLDDLIQQYTRTQRAYADLALELSTTIDDFGRYMIDGVSNR